MSNNKNNRPKPQTPKSRTYEEPATNTKPARLAVGAHPNRNAPPPTTAEVSSAIETITNTSANNPGPEINDSPPVGTLPDLGDPEEGELKADSCQPSAGEAEPLGPPDDTPAWVCPCGEQYPIGFPECIKCHAKPSEEKRQTITIEIPIGALSSTGYITRHVEVNHLSTDQQQALNRLLNGLRAAGAKLTDSDRLVDKPPDAVRWMLEKVAEAVESSQ